jgi:predicted dinucleotide-binding enzyme
MRTEETDMKIAVLGTGVVGRTVGAKLAELGHAVVIGTRHPEETLARTETDNLTAEPFAAWRAAHADIGLATFAEAGAQSQLVVNATAGAVSLAALEAVGAEHLAGKVVLDISNALDFSNGFPPTLSVANTDSVAEQLQRAFPDAKVVKSLNTINAFVMVDPARVPGHHHVFVAGDDADAKSTVTALLRELGWEADAIIDLGGVRSARAAEMYVILWVTLYGAFGSGDFNIEIHRA